MPIYDGASVGTVISPVERFDVETWLRSAPTGIPDRFREILLALLHRDREMVDRLETMEDEADTAADELIALELKLEEAEAGSILKMEILGNYADLVTALRGWLTAYPDHPQLEAELRDHEEVLRGYQPKEEKSV